MSHTFFSDVTTPIRLLVKILTAFRSLLNRLKDGFGNDAWEDMDFPRVVNDAWEDMDFNLPGGVDDFTLKIKAWNKETFGNVFANKRRTLARILGVQRAIANRPSSFLLNLQDQLSKEFNQILQWE